MEAKYQLEAREDGIDISIDIIGYAAVDVFHAAMKNAGLNERQILKCKDLRKRMRNRIAANKNREETNEKLHLLRTEAAIVEAGRREQLDISRNLMEERDYWKWKILDLAYEIGQSDHPEDLIETLGNNDDKELYFKLVNEGL